MPLNYGLALVLALMDWKNPKDPAPSRFGLLNDAAVERLKSCLKAAIEVEKDKDQSEVRNKSELLTAKISGAEASLRSAATTAVNTATSELRS